MTHGDAMLTWNDLLENHILSAEWVSKPEAQLHRLYKHVSLAEQPLQLPRRSPLVCCHACSAYCCHAAVQSEMDAVNESLQHM